MSETETLRDMLSKHGVEYRTHDLDALKVTYWGAYEDGCEAAFTESVDGRTCLTLDFEQATADRAIDATILADAKTSRVRRNTTTMEFCDRCGGAVLPQWDKCPWCGAKFGEKTT